MFFVILYFLILRLQHVAEDGGKERLKNNPPVWIIPEVYSGKR